MRKTAAGPACVGATHCGLARPTTTKRGVRRFSAALVLVVATVGALASGTTARAAVTTRSTVPIDVFVLVPCTGDVVEVTGPLNVMVSLTVNERHVSGVELFQPQGVSGIDLSTGTTYRGTGETATTFSASLTNGQAQETFVNNFNLIGQGSTADYRVHENTTVTIDADGTVAVSVSQISISCG